MAVIAGVGERVEPGGDGVRLTTVRGGLRWPRLVGVAFLLLAVAACGSSGDQRVAASSPMPTATPTDRASAQEQADRLLALATVPAGARRLARAPAALGGPATGIPAVSSLVDASRFWRVAMPFAQTLTWLRAHPPAGLRWTGASSSSGAGSVQTAGLAYASPSSGGQGSQLEMGVAPDGEHASVIRADAIVIWLDTTPLRDSAAGPRLRVTAAGGCPGSDRGVVGVTNPGPGLDQRLVPLTDPTGGLLCRYYGGNGRPFARQSEQHLDAAGARRLAAEARQMPLSHVTGGVTSCPADDGAAAVLVLGYTGLPDVDLWLRLGGCGGVSNGHVTAAFGRLPLG